MSTHCVLTALALTLMLVMPTLIQADGYGQLSAEQLSDLTPSQRAAAAHCFGKDWKKCICKTICELCPVTLCPMICKTLVCPHIGKK